MNRERTIEVPSGGTVQIKVEPPTGVGRSHGGVRRMLMYTVWQALLRGSADKWPRGSLALIKNGALGRTANSSQWA